METLLPCVYCTRYHPVEKLLLCPCEQVVYCSQSCYDQHMVAGHALEHASLIGPPKPTAPQDPSKSGLQGLDPIILDFNNRLKDADRTRKDFAEYLQKLYPPAYYPYKVRHQETAIQPRFDLDPTANRMAISVRSAPQRLVSDYFGPWTNVRGGIIGWPTGAGKTVAIHTIAKNYRHEVVDMPSPRRSAADLTRDKQKRICFIVTEATLIKDVMKDVWVQADTNASKIVDLIERDANLKLQGSLIPSAFSSINVLSPRRMTNLIAGRGELGRKLWAGLDPQDPRDVKIGAYPTAPNAYYRYTNPDGSTTWARNRLPHDAIKDAIPSVTRLNVTFPLRLAPLLRQSAIAALKSGFARLGGKPAWQDRLDHIDEAAVLQQEPLLWRFWSGNVDVLPQEYDAERQEQFALSLLTLQDEVSWDEPPVSEEVVLRKNQPAVTKTYIYHHHVFFSARHGNVDPVTGKAGRWMEEYTGRTEVLASNKLGKLTVIPLNHPKKNVQLAVLPPTETLRFNFHWKFKPKKGAAQDMTDADWADYVVDTLAAAARGWKAVNEALGQRAAERLLIEPVGIDSSPSATGYRLVEQEGTGKLSWVQAESPDEASDYNWPDRAVFLIDEAHRIFDPAEAPPGEHVNFDLFTQALKDSPGLRVFYFSATIDLFAGLGMARTLVPRAEQIVGTYPRENVAALADYLPTIRHVSKLNYEQVAQMLGPLFDVTKGGFRGDELAKVGNALKGLFSVTQIANMRDYFAQVRDRRVRRYPLPVEHSLALMESVVRRLSYKRIAAQILYSGDLSVHPPSAYVLGHPEYDAERCLRELVIGTDTVPALLPGALPLLQLLRRNAREHLGAWQSEAKQGCTMSVADDKHGINLYASALHAAGYTWVPVERRQLTESKLTAEEQAALEKARRTGTVPKDTKLRSVYLAEKFADAAADASEFRANFIKEYGPVSTPSYLLVLSDSLIRQTGTLKPPTTLNELQAQQRTNFQLDTRFRFLSTGAALSSNGVVPPDLQTASPEERVRYQQLRQLLKGQALYYWPGQSAVDAMRKQYERVDGPTYSKLISKPRFDPAKPHWFLRKKGADDENPDKFAAQSITGELEQLQEHMGLSSVLDVIARLAEFDTHLSDDQRADLLQTVTERWNSPANVYGDLARVLLIGGTTTQGFDIKDTLYQNNLDIAKNRTDEIQRSGRYLRRDGMPNIRPFEHRQLMITTLQAEWHPNTLKATTTQMEEVIERKEQERDEDYVPPEEPPGLPADPMQEDTPAAESSENPTGGVAGSSIIGKPVGEVDDVYADLAPEAYQPTVRNLFEAKELTAAQEAAGKAQRAFTVEFGKVAGEHAVLTTFETELPPNAPKRVSASDPIPPYAAMRMRYQSPSLAAIIRLGTQRFAEFAFDGDYSRAKVDSAKPLGSDKQEIGAGWVFAPTHWSLMPEAITGLLEKLKQQIAQESAQPSAPISDDELIALVPATKRAELEQETIEARTEDGDWAGASDEQKAKWIRNALLRHARKNAPTVNPLRSPLQDRQVGLEALSKGSAIPLYRRLAADSGQRDLFYTLGKGKTPTKKLDVTLLGVAAPAGGSLEALQAAGLVQFHLDVTSVAEDSIASNFYKRKERTPPTLAPEGEGEAPSPAKKQALQPLEMQQFFCGARCVQVGAFNPLTGAEEEEEEEALVGVPRSNVLEAADFPDQEQNALETHALTDFIRLAQNTVACWNTDVWRRAQALLDFAERRGPGDSWERVVADFEKVRDRVYAKLTGQPEDYTQHSEATLLRLKIAIIELYKYGITNWRRAFGLLAAVYLNPRFDGEDDLETAVRLIGSTFYLASNQVFQTLITPLSAQLSTSPLHVIADFTALCFQWTAVYSPDTRYPTLNGPLAKLVEILDQLSDVALLDVPAQYPAIADAIFTSKTRSGNIIKVSTLPSSFVVVLTRLLASELAPIPRSDIAPVWPVRKPKRPAGEDVMEEEEAEEAEEEEEEEEEEEGYEQEEPGKLPTPRKKPVRRVYSDYGRWLVQLAKNNGQPNQATAALAPQSVLPDILRVFGFPSDLAGSPALARARNLKKKFELLAIHAAEHRTTEPASPGVPQFLDLWDAYTSDLPQDERAEHLAALFRQGPGRGKTLADYKAQVLAYNDLRAAYSPTGFERKTGTAGDWQQLWRTNAFPHDWVYLSPALLATGKPLVKVDLQEIELYADFVAKRVTYANPAIALPHAFTQTYLRKLYRAGGFPADDIDAFVERIHATPATVQTLVYKYETPRIAGQLLGRLHRLTQQELPVLIAWMLQPTFDWVRLEHLTEAIAFVLPERVPEVLRLVSGPTVTWLWEGRELDTLARVLVAIASATEEPFPNLLEPVQQYMSWLRGKYDPQLESANVATEVAGWIMLHVRELIKEREEEKEQVEVQPGEAPAPKVPKSRSNALERAKEYQRDVHLFFKYVQTNLQGRVTKLASAGFATFVRNLRPAEAAATVPAEVPAEPMEEEF